MAEPRAMCHGSPMRIRLVMATAILAVAAAGCTSVNMLDTDNLESVLKEQIESQTTTVIASVDCPDDVEIEKGATSECTAEDTEGTTFTIEVTQTDDQGNVDWEVTDASA